MSGPMRWWLNRKSKLGLAPSARMPPHLPGKPWWTDPPTTIPQPEHIEFVIQFMTELQRGRQSQQTQALMSACSAWMRAARRLLHETFENEKHGDLVTTDGLILAVHQLVHRMTGKAKAGGYAIDERDQATIDALNARAAKVGRERAVDACKRVSIHPTLYRAKP